MTHTPVPQPGPAPRPAERGTARAAGRGGLPPRRALPRDVVVPVLPGLGLAWYDRRGAGYVARRAGMSLVMVLAAAVATAIIVGILIAFFHRSLAAFTVVLVIELAGSLGTLAFFAAMAMRTWNDPHPVTIRPGNVAGQVFLVLSALTAGPYLYLALASLLPETPSERHARLLVAEQLRGRRPASAG